MNHANSTKLNEKVNFTLRIYYIILLKSGFIKDLAYEADQSLWEGEGKFLSDNIVGMGIPFLEQKQKILIFVRVKLMSVASLRHIMKSSEFSC